MNRFFISGNLTTKPELKESKKEGITVKYCTLSIASNRTKDIADYFDLITFEDTAINCCKYLDKGSKILATCLVRNKNIKENKTCNCHVYSFVAQNVEFMGNKIEDKKEEKKA